MERHHLYAGFRVASRIPLLPLPCASDDTAHPVIQIEHASPAKWNQAGVAEWLHSWRGHNGHPTLEVALAPGAGHESGERLLRAPGHCDFLVDPDNALVTVDGNDDLDAHTLEHLLLDQVLPRLLAARGHLMAHASLVQVGDRCVAFLGESGWGKSTLAGLLRRRGYTALCDDCARLDVTSGRVFATPAYPGMRLFADSIAKSFDDSPETTPVSDYSHKQRVIDLRLSPVQLDPRPLAALYLLDAPAQGTKTPSLGHLTPALACMALVEHGFRLDPTVPAGTARVLRQASAVANAVPAYSLRYPRDFTQSSELLDLLSRHFEELDSTPA